MDMKKFGEELAQQDFNEITAAYDRAMAQSTQTLGHHLSNLVQEAHRERISSVLYRTSIYGSIVLVIGWAIGFSPQSLSTVFLVAIVLAILMSL